MGKLKLIKNLILSSLIIFISLFILSSCTSNNTNNNPEDLIKDAYGDETFKISFYQDNLETPIDDIYYSANNIPKLPTPTKLGYIFEGWFYDIDYTIPYEDNSLYLYMKNVVLYAKFQEEEFVANGIYDIEYDCSIVEETIEKSELTDTIGFKDITKDIIPNEIYIEKNDNGKFLKFTYDSKHTVSMSSEAPYSVTIDASMSLKCKITNTIDALNDPVKTIFIDISKLSLNDDILFYVTSLNYDNNSLSQSQINDTKATYLIKFNITKLLGYRTGFENKDNELSNGNYLVKTFYKTISNESSMMDSFNSVYAYLNVKNGHYKLIKQFYPYEGMVGTSSIKNYYSRLISFGPVNLFYRLNNFDYTNKDKITSNNYLNEYDAKEYGNLSIEFDSATGKFYYIYDLGDNYKMPIFQEMSVSGYMEVASAMGSVSAIMYIDDSIVKLSTIDYNELNLDNGYVFNEVFDYYPGNNQNISMNEEFYYSSINYGICNYYYNTIYTGNSVDDIAGRRYYSYKINVTPNYLSNVKDSINEINTFNREIIVYGYDGVSNLYFDTMAVQKYKGSGLRKCFEYKNGKSFNLNDDINIEDLFKEKISKNVDFNHVKYTIYDYKNNKIDYDNPYYEINKFNNKCIIFFEFDGYISTLILDLYEEPEIIVENYDESYSYMIGEIAEIADVKYNFMGYKYSFIDNFYMSGDGDKGIDPVWSFYYEKDNKEVNYFMKESLKMELTSNERIIVYELRNIYNEKYYKELSYKCYGSQSYLLYDNDGNEIESGKLKLYENDENKRQAISTSNIYANLIYDINEIDEIKDKKYYLKIDAKGYSLDNELELTSVTYHSKTKSEIYYASDYSNITSFIDDIKNKALVDSYAKLSFHFKNYSNAYEGKEDSYTISYVYNLIINGKKAFDITNLDTYFVGKTYYFVTPILTTPLGEATSNIGSYDFISTSTNSASSSHTGSASSSHTGYQYAITFNQSGKYYIRYTVTLSTKYSDDEFFDSDTNICLKDEIEVYDGLVTITYHTDSEHPFRDGTLVKKVEYNPYENILPLDASYYDVTTKSKLFGYYLKSDFNPRYDKCYDVKSFDYINTFTSKNIDLYAYFDDGIRLTINYSEINGTTYSPLNVTYYRNVSLNSYRIDLYELNIKTAPQGYKFAGLTGGFLGTDLVIPEKNSTIYNIYDSSNINLYAVYKKECIISYQNRSEIKTHTGTFKANDIVYEGDRLIPIVTTDDSVFKGYYIYGDETKTLLDLDTFIVTSDIKLVAVFEDGE